MAIIKCKMCGGDIEISADKTFGTCEYCGSTMTLPKTDDDQRLSLFNRGTHLRRNGEFDKAAAIYERLIGENDADAEAHWNLLLCRYGIEYVQDPASGERIPTCHRASFDSILNDVDYQAALKYSDGVARSLYEKEAQRIASLQKDILAISQKETPFDVFICYKESDENGKRTKDSALAQDIYYQLTDAGYKVFFARITLEDKLGQEYEPYIFAALHSAKVMVVVGTKPEYLNAVWVKNEWSRYLALMRTDRSRLLIPCYRDMDPYDMPEELSMLQSQDMGKIGFIQDLIRGVKKVVDAAKPQEAVTETVKETVVVHNEGGSNVQALLDRGQMALEDGEWTKADEFFEQVLNQDAKCGAAYLGKFLAKARKANVQAYVQSICAGITADAPTKRNAEACAEDQAFIDACIRNYQVPEFYAPMDIRTALRFDRGYCADRAAYFRETQKKVKSALDADRNFARAEKFADGETKVQCSALRTEIMTFLRQQEQKAEQEAAVEKQRVTEAYHAFLKAAAPRLAAAQKEALAKKRADEEAAEQARIKEAQRAEDEKLVREMAAWEAARKKKRTILIVAAFVAVFAAYQVVKNVVLPAVMYSKAEEMLTAGDYDGAVTAFGELGDYKDSAAMRMEAVNAEEYAQAEALLAAGDYDSAITAFAGLGDYKDAVERKAYCEAELFLEEGDAARAAISFGKSAGYQDARERSMALWDTLTTRATLASGNAHTAALKMDGTVIAVGENNDGQCDVSEWTDIVAISAGDYYTVGLKKDGTVVAAGNNENGQCNVSDWTDIVAISAAYNRTIGLKMDGTVVSAGVQCDVSYWTDIVAISAGYMHIVGLRANGTVVVADNNVPWELADRYVEGDAADWTDIVTISLGRWYTVGLKADGTAVAVGNNEFGQCDVSGWKDIVAISAGDNHTVGLKADGTVAAVGNNDDSQCAVSGWTDIVAISAGDEHTIGLKADGTVLAVGDNSAGQCDVSNWTDIKLPNK